MRGVAESAKGKVTISERGSPNFHLLRTFLTWPFQQGVSMGVNGV